MKKTIVMLAPHEPKRDPRVHWEAVTAGKEFNVVVLGMHEDPIKYPTEEVVDNYKIIRESPKNDTVSKVDYLGKLWKYVLGPTEKNILILLLIPVFPIVFISEFMLRLLMMVLDKMITGKVLKKIIKKVECRRFLKLSDGFRQFLWLQKHFCEATKTLVDAYAKSGLVADVIHCNDLNSLLAGVALKTTHNCKLVYDAHELWPVAHIGATAYQVWWFKYLEKKLIAYADYVITVSPQIAKVMEEWYGYKGVETVPNFEIWHNKHQKIDAGLRKLAGDRVLFLSQGSFSQGRGFEELIGAWENVDGKKALLVLRGPHHSYVDTLQELARAQIDEGKIVFAPAVEESVLVAAASEADVGIIPYRPTTLCYKYCCPNKISQYMQAGLAMLSNNLDYVKALIEEYDCGLTYDSDQPDTIVSTVNQFIEDKESLKQYQQNALKGGKNAIHWDAVSGPLLDAYRRLANPKKH